MPKLEGGKWSEINQQAAEMMTKPPMKPPSVDQTKVFLPRISSCEIRLRQNRHLLWVAIVEWREDTHETSKRVSYETKGRWTAWPGALDEAKDILSAGMHRFFLVHGGLTVEVPSVEDLEEILGPPRDET